MVHISAGTWTTSQTINFPVVSGGTAALECDAGGIINYADAGFLLDMEETEQALVNAVVRGCTIIGTATVAGIHTKAFNRGPFYDLRV